MFIILTFGLIICTILFYIGWVLITGDSKNSKEPYNIKNIVGEKEVNLLDESKNKSANNLPQPKNILNTEVNTLVPKAKEIITSIEESVNTKEINNNLENTNENLNKFLNIDNRLTGTKVIYTKVVGVTFENRQEFVKKCYTAQVLTLKRQPNNEFDNNAIAVYSEDGKLGYISKDLAKYLAPLIDKGINIKCIVNKVVGGNGYNYGLNISLTYTVKNNDYICNNKVHSELILH